MPGYQARFKTISERGLFLEGGLPYICPEFQNYEMALLGMLFLCYIFTKLRDQKQVLPTLCQKVIRKWAKWGYLRKQGPLWNRVSIMGISKKTRPALRSSSGQTVYFEENHSALRSSYIDSGINGANRIFEVMWSTWENLRKEGPHWNRVLLVRERSGQTGYLVEKLWCVW